MPQHANHLLLLLGFVLLSFFLPLSLAPLFDLDEGAFSEATREMILTEDYITTHLNGALRFDKPILIYWLQLISVKIFGISEFAFRLPSAITATLWAFLIYVFTKEQTDAKTGFFAALFMIASLQTSLIAKAAIADALLNLFLTLSLFLIYRFYQNRNMKDLYLLFAAMALGVLTKGPIAIAIPFVVSLLFFSLKKEFRLWLKSVFNPVGLLLFLIIALPWYIAEYVAHGELFIQDFFLKHNVGRFSNAMESHEGAFYYYIVVMIVGLLPFTSLVIAAFKNFKAVIKDDLTLFLWIWFGFVFLFFTFSGTKLPHYIIYGYTPLFILAARAAHESLSKIALVLPMLIFYLLLLFLPDLLTLFKDLIRDPFVVALIENIYDSFDPTYRVILILAILVTLWQLWAKQSIQTSILVLALTAVVSLNFAVVPAYGHLMQSPVKEAAQIAKQNGYQVVMYRLNMPSFNVYFENLVSKSKPKAGDILFCKTTSLKDFTNFQVLYQKNAFALIRLHP